MAKAYSTINTRLFYKASQSGQYVQCPKIKSYPDLGGAPSMIETTDLEDTFVTRVLGVQDIDTMEFTLNFNIDDYRTLETISQMGQVFWKLEFNEECSVEWKGEASVYATGGEVNAVREMTLSIAPSTKPTFTKMTPKYRVIYQGNGNTSGTVPEPTVVLEGQQGTFASGASLVKDGKEFVEWNTVADGTGTSYASGAATPVMTENIIVFAIYED